MRVKVCNIPVEPYIAKFVAAAPQNGWIVRPSVKFNDDDELKFSGRLPFTMHTKFQSANEYFENVDSEMVWITVYMMHVNKRTMYHLVQWLKSEFRKEMYAYTRMALKFGQFAKPSIQKFLEECDITDDEYNLESAHRGWLRYNKKLELKRQTTTV